MKGKKPAKKCSYSSRLSGKGRGRAEDCLSQERGARANASGDAEGVLVFGEFLHEFQLHLLNLQEAEPLVGHEEIEPFPDPPDLQFSLEVNAVILFPAQPFLGLLAVPAHHDRRGLEGGRRARHPPLWRQRRNAQQGRKGRP